MLPLLVRHCAWLITHYQVKSDGNTPCERLRGPQYGGQVAEFAEVVGYGHAKVRLQMEPRLVVGKEPGFG